MKVEEFVDLFDDFPEWSGPKQVDYWAFYLTAIVGQPSFQQKTLQTASMRHPQSVTLGLHRTYPNKRPNEMGNI